MSGREGPGPERPGPDYPTEWDTEPDGWEDDEQAEHDAWHPHWIEGCDACVDRADYLERTRPLPDLTIVLELVVPASLDDLAGAIIRTAHIVPPSADEVRVAVGDPFDEPPRDGTTRVDSDAP